MFYANILIFLGIFCAARSTPLLSGLEVWKQNAHFVIEKGAKQPFLWLADTCWELPKNLQTKEDGVTYFENRKARGFNTIQTVAVFSQGNNSRGEWPFGGHNHTDVTKINSKYFEGVDEVISLATQHGFYVALWPIWGSEWISAGGMRHQAPFMNTPTQSYQYGLFVGKRYKNITNIVFVIGGDIQLPPSPADRIWVYRTLAEGLAEGYTGLPRPMWNNSKDEAWQHIMMSLHPNTGHSSSQIFENDAWLDFNLIQSGWKKQKEVVRLIHGDYKLTNTKPTFMGEGAYEYSRGYRYCGIQTALEQQWGVRLMMYWGMLAGAFGSTYGAEGLWDWRGTPSYHHKYPWYSWKQALSFKGATQLHFLKDLLLSLNWTNLKPDLTYAIIPKNYTYSAQDCTQVVASSDDNAILAYTTQGAPVHVILGWEPHSATWMDPRDGAQSAAGTPTRKGNVFVYTPPNATVARTNDWLLILKENRF